jgi:SnoaL-like domain
LSITGIDASDVQGLLDRLAVRELVENWILYRDAQDWPRVEALWHPDGRQMTTWGGSSSPQEFARAASAGYEAGVRMLHSVGGVAVTVKGTRGLALSKTRIMQRGLVEGVLCDVTCIGHTYNFAEKRDDCWGLVLRQPIYERDSISTVDPSETVELDQERLARYPEGYARLAYLQEEAGYGIVGDMPVLEGVRKDALKEQGRAWLDGGPLTWADSVAVPAETR